MAPKKSTKSKGQSSGSSRSRANPNSPTQQGIRIVGDLERERWDELVTKNIIPSRFLDQSVTQELRVNEEVCTTLKTGGLFKLLATPRHTYRELVLEFLSTLRLIGEPHVTRIHFRLRGNDYWLPVGELDSFLSDEAPIYDENEMYLDIPTWWWRLTKTTTPPGELSRFDSKNAKASHIRNPILRILQLLMRWSLFGRVDAGVINRSELELLWGCVTGRRPFLGRMIAEYLAQKAAHPRGGDMAFGGLITAIANCVGAPYDDLEPVHGPNKIDYEMLLNMKLLQMDRRGHRYWSVGSDYIPYDATPLISPWSLANYSMSSPDHRALMSHDPPTGGFMHAFTPTSTIIPHLTVDEIPETEMDFEDLSNLQLGFGGAGQPNIEQYVQQQQQQPGPEPGNRRRRHDDAGNYGNLETQLNDLTIYTHDFRNQYDQNWAEQQQNWAAQQQQIAEIQEQMAAERRLAAIRHWEMTNYFRQMNGLPPLPHPDLPPQ